MDVADKNLNGIYRFDLHWGAGGHAWHFKPHLQVDAMNDDFNTLLNTVHVRFLP